MSSLDASLASSKSTPCSSLDHQPQSQDQQQPLNANSCSCSCPGNNANSGSSDQEPQHCSTPKKNNLNNNNQSITSQSEGEESGMKKDRVVDERFHFPLSCLKRELFVLFQPLAMVKVIQTPWLLLPRPSLGSRSPPKTTLTSSS